MRLVDDQIFHRDFERAIVAPVEVVEDQTRTMLIGVIPIGLHAPYITAADGPGIGIHEDLALVEAMSDLRLPGAVKTVAILGVLVV